VYTIPVLKRAVLHLTIKLEIKIKYSNGLWLFEKQREQIKTLKLK